MDDGLVGAAEGKERHGDDVHPLDEVGNAREGPGEEERHQADEHRGGNGVGIVEHVDAAGLHGHVADEAAAQAAERSRATSAPVRPPTATDARSSHAGSDTATLGLRYSKKSGTGFSTRGVAVDARPL